ncbi:chemotaxis protein CheW [Desulfotomaculum copahuensis]|uniref:chemotaxis protein CheW n=1 Tax=Desulfotomaculum copahuensis TaxID=1838280 RepID=UPI0009902E87|nr:chemotaxis protein CheW [Desulfotomaculum copahuensis]
MSDGSNRESAELQLVVFRLKEQAYGADIGQVLEIIRATGITAIPGAPSFVDGVINLRGQVIPVIDTARRLGLPPAVTGEGTRIIIVDVDGITAGLIVDGVSEVLRLPASSVRPAPAAVGGVNAAYLQGIALLEERLIILVDMTRVLQADEKLVLQEIAAAGTDRPDAPDGAQGAGPDGGPDAHGTR